MLLVPLVGSGLKLFTGVSCPVQELQFGGSLAGTTIWDHVERALPVDGRLRCWPAGHAAGGFGLFGLRVMSGGKGVPLLAYGPGFVVGWSMGLYQIARGHHYLSHTVASMLIAWLIAATAAAICEARPPAS